MTRNEKQKIFEEIFQEFQSKNTESQEEKNAFFQKLLDHNLIPVKPGFFTFLGLKPDDADSLHNEYLLKISNSISNLRNPKVYEAWMKQIARRMAWNFLESSKKERKARNEASIHDGIDACFYGEDEFIEEDLYVENSLWEILTDSTLAILSINRRLVFFLRDVLKFSEQESVIILNNSRGNWNRGRIAVELHRVREDIMEHVKKQDVPVCSISPKACENLKKQLRLKASKALTTVEQA